MNRNFRKLSLLAVTLVAGLIMTATADNWAQEVPGPLKTATSKEHGTFLVDAKGMTLYLFDKDKEPDKSSCYGGCAKSWPPFAPGADDPAPKAPLSIITRDDGTRQYAYNGKPLYYYQKDAKAGEVTGQGRGKVWWVVKP